MANKALKTIKFPGLNDTYTIPQVDNTLAVSGAAADAKKTGDQLNDLKSAISQPTRNLVAGVIRGVSINADSVSGIIAVNASYDMYYAPVESGKTYYVNTNDSSGLVYGYYSSIPVTGSTATAVGGHYRFIDTTNKYFTSQATGYVAFRTMANFA
mgnify:CR=1 FL=1